MTQTRLVLLTDGRIDQHNAKIAVALLRYRRASVVCIFNRELGGQNTRSFFGDALDAPIVGSIEEALATQPSGLIISMAPAGGLLPEEWFPLIREFLRRGLSVISGMHQFLSDIAEFATLSAEYGGQLVDLRRPPASRTIGSGRALTHRGLRVLTVGSDECIGKMTAALELELAARESGWSSAFIATGQTGIAISGSGVSIDAVVSDFVAGAVEDLVLAQLNREVIFIEGQGAITSASFSGVTVSLLHGCMPQALVLCHDPTRVLMRGTLFPLPNLHRIISIYEGLVHPFGPCSVVGVCVNTSSMAEPNAERYVSELERELKLPVTDPVRFGVQKVLIALEPLKARFG